MTRTIVLSTTLFLSTLLAGNTQAALDMDRQQIEDGFREHAALAQFYRWHIFYAEPSYGLENQLDILDPTIRVKSSLGEASGHQQYTEQVQQLPTAWKNAHFVESTDVSINDDGTVDLSAEVNHLNIGALDGGAVTSRELTYTTTLVPTDNVLPAFTNIDINLRAEDTHDQYESAYANNRMRSVVHYWLALIEDPARNAEPVKEILANEFRLNFSSGAITDFAGFESWLAGPASSVIASTHKMSNFEQQSIGDNEYRVSMDFDWNGILPNQAELSAKTRHTWVVVDDVTERFARIKTMDVEVLEPFAPK